MKFGDKFLGIVILILLFLNLLFMTFIQPVRAQLSPSVVSNIALSAGEKGVVYFYDGANLWVSTDYGEKWRKIK